MNRLIVWTVRRLDRLYLRMNRASPLIQFAAVNGLFLLSCGVAIAIHILAGRSGVLVFGFAVVALWLFFIYFGMLRHWGRDRRRKLRQRGNTSPKDFASVETQTRGTSFPIWFYRLFWIWIGLFGLLACVEIGIWLGRIPVPPNQTTFERIWATLLICGFIGAVYSLYWPLVGGFYLLKLAGAWLWRALGRSAPPTQKID